MKIIFIAIFFSFFQNTTNAGEWKCGDLKLMFNENPAKPGEEYSVQGCYHTGNYFLISDFCKNSTQSCLQSGINKKVNHPGMQMGSPAFVQCYKNGGRPRFLKIFIGDKWEDTSTCFFGNRNRFMDYDTIELALKKK